MFCCSKVSIQYEDHHSEVFCYLQETALKLENDALGSSSGLSALKQLDKKKKTTDEMFMKANEAETTYKSCVIDANMRQNELEKTKVVVLLGVSSGKYLYFKHGTLTLPCVWKYLVWSSSSSEIVQGSIWRQGNQCFLNLNPGMKI